jgi:uncharacterized protein DUF1064
MIDFQTIVDSYRRLKSVWKVAQELGISGQNVHKKLRKFGIIQNNFFKPEEKKRIQEFYENGFLPGDGKLDEFCRSLSRKKHNICRFAKTLGLTSYKREKSKKYCQELGKRSKKWHKTHEHPRGMLGKTHSEAHRENRKKAFADWYRNATDQQIGDRVRKSFRTKLKKYGSIAPINPHVTWRQGWRTVGGRKIYFRSRWEANYGRYLEFLKTHGNISDWEHEPKTFWFDKIKRGSITYLPDYKVHNNDGTHCWVEVKGWMDSRSKTKIKRFRKYFPEEKLTIISGDWFKKNGKQMKELIGDWECD